MIPAVARSLAGQLRPCADESVALGGPSSRDNPGGGGARRGRDLSTQPQTPGLAARGLVCSGRGLSNGVVDVEEALASDRAPVPRQRVEPHATHGTETSRFCIDSLRPTSHPLVGRRLCPSAKMQGTDRGNAGATSDTKDIGRRHSDRSLHRGGLRAVGSGRYLCDGRGRRFLRLPRCKLCRGLVHVHGGRRLVVERAERHLQWR